jgi:hypothetical protein
MTDERQGAHQASPMSRSSIFDLSTSQDVCYVITLRLGGQQAFRSSLWLISFCSFSISRCRRLRSVTGVSRVLSAILFVAIQEATLEQDTGILDSTPLPRPASLDNHYLGAKELSDAERRVHQWWFAPSAFMPRAASPMRKRYRSTTGLSRCCVVAEPQLGSSGHDRTLGATVREGASGR